MPLWVASILGGLVQVAGTLVGRVLLSLGLGFVTYSGIDTSLDWAKDMFVANINALPVQAVQAAGLLKIGTAVSMLCSAVLVRVTIRGLSGGSITKMVQK